MISEYNVEAGKTYPLGATVQEDGINFSVFSISAVSVELLLFDYESSPKPSRVIKLDPFVNRTFYYWHIKVRGLKSGQIYAFRVTGPFDLTRGHRYDLDKVLLDPYSKLVATGKYYNRQKAIDPGDNCAFAMKSIAVDPNDYDWEGDAPLQNGHQRTVIYELHVKGFTANPNSGVSAEKRGTYAGLIEKIPYLKALGVTAVELMPIQQFDEYDAKQGLTNYWGYSPIAFFAPHRAYSSDKSILGPINEFRDMVKALHKADIQVILDVVFNHTAEGDETGPTLSFKGLGNKTYYILQNDRKFYANYSGCGNTINANNSIVRHMILECLKYWVSEMHIDGFRFDLASVLSRDDEGIPLKNPPLLWEIESDPVLAGTKIIAEAWDAAGLYQVGKFIGERWAEWNGKYRDEIRRFVKSDAGMVEKVAFKIAASPDVYSSIVRHPERNINFVTCHDGFTLNDLVSYNTKYNDANRENNADGNNDNLSWNCGFEGITNDDQINALRLKQIKNFYTILLFSQGTPLILMGDEVLRTQSGNNNAYCQDNELSWFDWSLVEKNADLLRFTKSLINFTQKYRIFRLGKSWLPPAPELSGHITWHGTKLNKPDFTSESRNLAFTLNNPGEKFVVHVMLNAFWEEVTFELPKPKNIEWHILIDTNNASPNDFTEEFSELTICKEKFVVAPRATAVLFGIKK